jgi:hypothetical protein
MRWEPVIMMDVLQAIFQGFVARSSRGYENESMINDGKYYRQGARDSKSGITGVNNS